MRSLRWARLGVMVVGLLLAAPSGAMGNWPLAGSQRSTTLGFGASYRAVDGSTATHRGVDLAGDQGEPVVSPLAGTVSFVGRIPAATGGTVLAVTVQTASGALTMLPFASATVTSGDELASGDSVGSLAADGDGSSSATHLHVGLRKGTLYMDPEAVLAPVPAQSGGAEAGEVSVEAVDAGAEVSLAGAVVAAGVSVGMPSGVRAGTGETVRGTQSVGARGTVAQGQSTAVRATAEAGAAGELAPGVTLSSAVAPMAASAPTPGIVAETGRAIAAGGSVVRAASSAVASGGLGTLFSRAIRLVRSAGSTLALIGLAVLCGLGALWPLWRGSAVREGLSKVPVSVVREDVAAVASR